jgi:hypothetical protein
MATEPRSSEPMPAEPIASSGMTGEPAATDIRSAADIGADAALVLAAVMRMQEADRQTRETLKRLGVGLGEMAAAIGRAKAKVADTDDSDAAAKAVDTATMLDELEHLVDGMIEIATGESGAAAVAETAQLAMEAPPPADQAPASDIELAAAAEAANADQVPTVSGVVSRLDPEQPAAEPAPASARDVAIAAAAAGPTVEMLKSLVEALNASIPAESSTVQRMGELSAIPAKAEAAAQEVIQAFARELTRGAAADGPHEGALEAAAVEETVREVQAAEQMPPATAEATEPLVFDVLVEFDPVEPRPEARPEAIEPAAQVAKAVAPHADAEPAEDPASVTAAERASAEAILTEETPAEAAPAETASIGDASTETVSIEESSAEDALAEHALDDWPAMPFEASFEDIAAEPQPAVAAPAEPLAAQRAQPAATAPAEPASAGAQPAYALPTNDVIYEVELLARFEQMEAVPILPPELGTAVIFQPRHLPATEAANLPEARAPEAAAAEARPKTPSDDGDSTAGFNLPMDLLPTVDLDIAPRAEIAAPVEPAAGAEPAGDAAPEATTEAAALAVAQSAEEAASEAEAFAEPAAAPEPLAEPEIAAASEPEPAAAPEPADAEFDSDDFLFGSNGQTNGAGESALAATTDSADAPSAELAAAPSPADEAASGGAGEAAAPPRVKVAADPLIPIKAMSPEERIALFS